MTSRSKFNVSKDKSDRTFGEITFDSVMEMKYYSEVILPLFNAGKIVHYELQKKYVLQKGFVHNGKKVLPIEYKADFYIKYSDGKEEVVDIKGFADATAKLKRKMFWYIYPQLNYIWVSYSKIDGGWIQYEDVQKNRKNRRKLKQEHKDNEQN